MANEKTKTPATATRPSTGAVAEKAAPNVEPTLPPGAPVRTVGETLYQEEQLKLIDGTVLSYCGPWQIDHEGDNEVVAVSFSPQRRLILG